MENASSRGLSGTSQSLYRLGDSVVERTCVSQFCERYLASIVEMDASGLLLGFSLLVMKRIFSEPDGWLLVSYTTPAMLDTTSARLRPSNGTARTLRFPSPAYIRQGMTDIARPGIGVPWLDVCPTSQFTQYPGKFVEVILLPLHVDGLSIRPFRFGSQYRPIHSILDEREIPRLLPVPKSREAGRPQGLDEFRYHRSVFGVRALPGTVDIEILNATVGRR